MSQLQNVEVLPGLELALLPGEDQTTIAAELEALFGEIEHMPWLGEEPSDEEIDAMFLDYDPVSDPTYVDWEDEGAPVSGATWNIPSHVARLIILPAEDRSDWIGA